MSHSNDNVITLAVIGCGGRGRIYSKLAAQMPEHYRLVAVADPLAARRQAVMQTTGSPQLQEYEDAESFFTQPQMADVAMICSQDAMHVNHAKLAMEAGYNLLLEKPVATNLSDLRQINSLAQELGRKVIVCHVLRYAPAYEAAKQIIDNGKVGKIITIDAREGVAPFHQAHSYVRGNWADTTKASPMILAKSCHDMDLLAWFADSPCSLIASFGSLTHFTHENMPEGAPPRCIDGCPVATTCPYNAEHYWERERKYMAAAHENEATLSREAFDQWLRESPYGRCVYRCDNDAVDHQVVAAEFENSITATFTMTAFDTGRHLRICGTQGVLDLDMHANRITLSDHRNEQVIPIMDDESAIGYDSHGGGDAGLMQALYQQMLLPPEKQHTSLQASIHSHFMALAADNARQTHQVVSLKQFIAETEPRS